LSRYDRSGCHGSKILKVSVNALFCYGGWVCCVYSKYDKGLTWVLAMFV
jgi:hypothetical protein